MDFFGYVATALIGLSLGMIGGGGSILTIPVLVYLFNVTPTLATSYSLFIVGCTSTIGGVKKAFEGLVDFKLSLAFAIPSFAGAYISRIFFELIPGEMILFSTVVTKDVIIMIFFSVVMLIASMTMLTGHSDDTTSEDSTRNLFVFLISGFAIGLMTGVIGIGGGFLIIPALVMFARIPMKKAVGTSLVIIAAKSIIGFAWDVQSTSGVDYLFMTIVSAVAIIGIFVGSYWSKFIGGQKLKKGFGWFILLMGVGILVMELQKNS